MDKPVGVQVDADVIDRSVSAGGEKHKIARLQFALGYRSTTEEKFGTGSGQARRHTLHAIANKAGTVEAVGGYASRTVRCADEVLCPFESFLDRRGRTDPNS